MHTRLSIIVILGFVTLFISGCGVSPQGVTIPIRLNEATVNGLITNAQGAVSGSNETPLLAEISSIDFRAEGNTIRVNGTHAGLNGDRVEGNNDLSFNAVQNALQVQVENVNIPGLDLNSEPVRQLNEALSSAFSQSAAENQQGNIKSVRVTDDALEITIEARLGQ